MDRKTYYTMSFTWGLPLALCGLLVAAVLMIMGYRPKRFGWAWYFEIGRHWGGLDLGLIFLCCKDASNVTKAHEYGHSFQNCKYGFAMIFITLASIARYWYYTLMERLGKALPDYESWWFEAQATEIGLKNILNIGKK